MVIRGSTRLGDQLCGQHGVHGARTKALEIEGDVMETQLLKNTSERGGHRRGESAWQFFPSDLDAHDCAMVPHAILPESESAQRLRALLYGGKRLGSDRSAIFNARRQTR